jgi:hypothetical protein
MTQKNRAEHLSNCQITAENAVITSNGSTPNVPMQKRKKDAKKILYLNRI